MNGEFNNSSQVDSTNQVDNSSVTTNNGGLDTVSNIIESKGDKNNKKSKKLIIIIIAILLLLISVVSFIFIFGRTGKVLLYVNSDKELKYITTTNKTGVLAKQYEGEIDAKYNSTRDKVLYVKDRNLYLMNLKNNKNDKIGVDIKKYGFISKNQIYFLDADKRLYLYEKNDRKKLDIDVEMVLYQKKNIIIYNKDNNLYLYDLKNDLKEIVMNNYITDKKVFLNSDLTKILYLSKNKDANTNTMYLYDIETKKNKTLAQNVNKIINKNDDFSKVIYDVSKGAKKYYELVIDDDLYEKDKGKTNICAFFDGPTEFVYSSPEDKTYNLFKVYGEEGYYYFVEDKDSMFGYTREKASQELINSCSTDYNSFELKGKIRGDNSIIDFYDVYIYDNNQNTQIASDVTEVVDSSISEGSVLYKKYRPLTNKMKMSQIKSMKEYEALKEQLKYSLEYKKGENEVSIMSSNQELGKSIISNNKVYYEIKDKKVSLNRFNLDTKAIDQISESGKILAFDIDGYDLIYFDNYETDKGLGDLYLEKNGEKVLVDTNVIDSIDYRDNKFYYYKDFDKEKNTGSYIINDLSDNPLIVEDVYLAIPVSGEEFYILKDYSYSSKSASLYKYESGKYKTIEYNVTEFDFSDW